MRTRFAAIDGLRGLAALYVTLFHIIANFYPVTVAAVPWYLAPFRFGHFAVSVFIVLSGFCLAYPLIKNNAATFGAYTFIKRRAIRLLPAFWIATALAFVVQTVYWHRPVTVTTVLTHVLMLQDVFSYESLTYPYWSLAIEWRIYFVFAALVFLWKRTSFSTMAVIGIVLGLSMSVALQHTFLHAMMWHYLALFFFGAAAAHVHYHDRYPVSVLYAVSCLSLALFCYCLMTLGPVDAKIMPHLLANDLLIGIGFSALLVVMIRSARWCRVLSVKPIALLGAASYSLYLVHAIVIMLVSNLVLRPSQTTCLAYLAIALPIILVFSYLFYRVFERPFVEMNTAA